MAHEATPGILLAVVGPSGVGKSSLCDRLLQHNDNLKLSVSFTTRAPRGDERNGVDYWFVDEDTFMAKVARGEFIEYARVHSNFYGTAIDVVREARDRGVDLLFDIDYQGMAQLKSAFPDAVGVMVVPPSMELLEERLRGRSTDSEEVIAARLAFARTELSQVDAFDYVVVNDALEQAYHDLLSIYRVQRLTLLHQRPFVVERLLT